MNILPEKNGDLTFELEPGDAEAVESLRRQARVNLDHEVLAGLLDHFGFSGNGRYLPISPADIRALTDAPMFSNRVLVDDAGHRQVVGDVWFFPAYEAEFFARTLVTTGRVRFTKASTR